MDRRFLIIMAIVLAGFIGIFIYSSTKNSDNNDVGSVSNHTQGANTGGVELVVYEDFQCPACGSFEPIVKEVTESFGDQISYTFRHFPLDNIHPNARAAHRAAEAAGKQDKFWEMHDIIFSNQEQWSSGRSINNIFEGYAKQLGLDIEKYNSDFASAEVNSTINADKAEGNDKGIKGTPSFFINGTQVNNSDIQSVELFKNYIQKIIDQNKQ